MCRLFGFRSIIPSQVHRSLMAADNALGVQSNRHPDGWGVAFYIDGSPHLTRSANTALGDQMFHRLSGIVSSETVIAHVRKATAGPVSVLNCHPFQYGRWTFAHNGDVFEFARHRARLHERIDPRLRRFILGETDSEVVFFLFLTHLARGGPIARPVEVAEAADALRATVMEVRDVCDGSEPESRSRLTLLVTDGSIMLATQGGKELFFSTHKTRCGDRDRCPHLATHCEAPATDGPVNHLVLSSEPIQGENVWQELGAGDVIAIDQRMRLSRGSVDPRRLPIRSDSRVPNGAPELA